MTAGRWRFMVAASVLLLVLAATPTEEQAARAADVPAPGSAGARDQRALPQAEQLDGSGVVVAIAGSGIDYHHALVGGDGNPDHFTANDPTVIEEGSFPTERVIGGVDLAGALYSAACPRPVPADVLCTDEPQPDDDPLDDAGGEGTALASIVLQHAAGARLVAIDIVGNPRGVQATSALHRQAIDWVVRHNRGEPVPGFPPPTTIDVLLLQGGAPFGGDAEALAQAALEAAAAGVALVAPAGDTGDTPFSVLGPAAAPHVLAVGAAYGADDSTWGIEARWPEGGATRTLEIEALDAQPPFATVAGTEPITGTLAWYGLACDEADGSPPEPAQDVSERIALIERGACTFSQKVANAQAMGAVAALLFTDHRGKTRPRGGGTPPEIPSLMIDRPPGLRLRELVEDDVEVQVRLDGDYEISLDGQIVGSSARGPARTGGISPLVLADGANVAVAVAGGGQATANHIGTAHAAARVAALVAQLAEKARREGWSLRGAELAALVTAHADPRARAPDGSPAGVARQGAGMIDPAATLAATTWLGHSADPAFPARALSLDLGAPRVGDPGGETHHATLSLRALSGPQRHFVLRWPIAEPDQSGMALDLPSQPLLLVPGADASVPITITFQPEALPEWQLDDGRALADAARVAAAARDGWLELEEVDEEGTPRPAGERLVVPIHALPRRGSCADPGPRSSGSPAGPLSQRHLELRNDCAGTLVVRVAGLGGVDAVESRDAGAADVLPATLDVRAVALRHGPADPAAPDGDQLLEFHVWTAAARHLAPAAAIDILLDLDQDGRFDRVLTTVDASQWRGGYARGDWRVLNAPLVPGTLRPDVSRALQEPLPLRWDLAERVTTVAVRAEELLVDLPAGSERFGYAVRVRDGLGGLHVHDDAPDDLATGGSFTFRQAAPGCGAVLDGRGQRVDRAGAELRVAPGATGELIAADQGPCGPPGPLLLSFPRNQLRAPAAVLWTPRPVARTAYLPVAITGSLTESTP